MGGAVRGGDRLYALVRLVVRFWVWFFFRTVDVRHPERLPRTGPVVLCINHPNNLIDSLLVGAIVARPVHYVATAALFRHPLVARFLRRCGVIPVYRAQEGPDAVDRNAEAFAAGLAVLRAHGVIAIYPEGRTHAGAGLERIKPGAARLALIYEAARRAAARPDTAALAVIPVGLNFAARKSFRRRVLVAFGPPVPVEPHLAQYREDPAKAVDALTMRIQWGLTSQVIHADRIDMAELGQAVEELFRDELVRQLRAARGLGPGEIDPFRLSRAIVEAAGHFKSLEPARVERLWHRIQGYRAMLAEHRVRDEAVRARLARPTAARRLRLSGQALVGLPFFVYGAAVNALPYLVPRWLSRRLARKETNYATVRFLVSIVAVPLFWGIEVWLVARLTSPAWALAFALSLPGSGLLAYHYLVGLGRLRSQLRLATLGLTHRQAAGRLLGERAAIVRELERARVDYLAAVKERLS